MKLQTPISDWQACHVFLSKRLTDGSRAWGALMRMRGPDGQWQYRRMTDEESADYNSREAW